MARQSGRELADLNRRVAFGRQSASDFIEHQLSGVREELGVGDIVANSQPSEIRLVVDMDVLTETVMINAQQLRERGQVIIPLSTA